MSGYRPLQENALEELRKRLAAGEFAPGVVYSESRIASELGISRTPVKDALVRLAQDRYIDILPSRGFRLHEMSDQDVQETFQLRTAIEGFCAISLARERGTDTGKETITLMQKSLESMRGALAAGAGGAVGRFAPAGAVREDAKVGKGEVEFQGIRGIQAAQGLGDLQGHAPVRRRACRQADAARSPRHVRIQGNDQLRRRNGFPLAEVGPTAPDHPAQEHAPALAGSARGGIGEIEAQAR